MKNILTKLLVLVLANTAHGQINWQEIQTPTDKDLKTIQFVSHEIGYVGGDSVLLKTMDGGATWTTLEIDSIHASQSQGADIFDMHWFDENHGIVMAGVWGGAFETFDGGINWANTGFANGGFCQTTSLFFFDEDNGFAGGAGCFEGHIIDRFSGGMWSTTNDPPDWNSDNWVASIEFKDALNGLAGTVNGTILRTTDGGMNWDTIPNLAGGSTITDFIFYGADFIRATHKNSDQFGVMISNDAGLTWQPDNETFTFFYPRMNAGHLDANGTTYLGGATGSEHDGVIFDNSGTFWNHGTVEHPISDITSYGDSITFLVGDSGAIYVNVDLTALGVEDVVSVEFNLSPNPTTGQIEISGLEEQITGYSIVDVTGKTILGSSQESTIVISIDVSDLTAGSYVISIQTPSGIGTKRFLKH